MSITAVLAATVFFLSGGPAGASEAAPREASRKAEDEKVVCRRREDPAAIGTRIRSAGQRVCMTKAEWDDERHRSQDAVRDLRTGAASTASGDGQAAGPG